MDVGGFLNTENPFAGTPTWMLSGERRSAHFSKIESMSGSSTPKPIVPSFKKSHTSFFKWSDSFR